MALPSRQQIHPVLLRTLLDFGEAAKPAVVVPIVTKAFPELTEDDLKQEKKDGTNKWTNRVHWARQDLVISGHIDGSQRGIWRLTPQGQDRARQIQPVGGCKPTPYPGRKDGKPPPIEVAKGEHERISQRLIQSSIDSRHPQRLEVAVAEALQFLGFDAAQIGGSGQTDVLVQAHLGPRRFRVVVDAKSTASHRVADTQINWLSIDKHRQEFEADYAVVVGPEFAGGAVKDNAEQFDVCLMKAQELADLVQMHATRPFALTDLAVVFGASPYAAAGLADARAAAHARARRAQLAWFLLQQIDQFNRSAPDDVMAKAEVLWGAVVASQDLSVQGSTMNDVRDVLQLLETIGILADANGDGYVSQTSTTGAVQMLAQFAGAHFTTEPTTTDSVSSFDSDSVSGA